MNNAQDNQAAYEALANAIIAKAADDFRAAARAYKRHITQASAKADEMLGLARFFLGASYGKLTSLEGGVLLEQLMKEYDEIMKGKT